MPIAELTTYTSLKTLHVLATVVWLGGGIMIAILGVRALRSNDPLHLATIGREVAAIAGKLFPVMGIVLIGTGFWMIANGDLDYDLWVIVALVGWAITFITGLAVLGPSAERMSKAIDEQGAASADAQDRVRRLLVMARIDLAILAIVVVDMVVKPT